MMMMMMMMMMQAVVSNGVSLEQNNGCNKGSRIP
jgi:hypothetical protein